MLSFVQNWFGPKPSPIGVDFGTDCLRLAQVAWVEGDHRLVAAASCDVPSHVRGNPAARMQFFSEAVRDLLSQGRFRGRQAVLALPAASMHVLHLKLPKLTEDELKKALPFEVRGKIAIDPSQAILRQHVAGEIYADGEPRQEVIVMAAHRELVNNLLAAAAKARLDVVGMNVEPKATIDCFSHVHRRRSDAETVTCYVDIGAASTRAVIALGTDVLFSRTIPLGGDEFTRAVAAAIGSGFDEAKMLRLQMAAGPAPSAAQVMDDPRGKREIDRAGGAESVAEEDNTTIGDVPSEENSFALLSAGLSKRQQRRDESEPSTSATAVATAPATAAPSVPLKKAEAAQHETALRLVDELNLCRRYHEATFPSKPVQKLIFVGGEARHRTLCQTLARQLGLAAQIGDPIVRMGKNSEIGIESGIDRRQPQPAWAVAIGLSMGPKHAAVAAAKAEAK
jgi:type IV pilus assembly protein PilM